MYSRRRVDANQRDIVRALRGCGASVQSLASIGDGCPDLLVGAFRVNVLLEVKDWEQPLSKRRLTPDEDKWHRLWRGQVVVVETVEQALRAVGVK